MPWRFPPKPLHVKKSILLIVLPFLLISWAGAQDTLVTSSEKITCKVYKISEQEVEYKKWNNLEGPTYTMAKNKVLYIRFSNGVIEQVNSIRKQEEELQTGRHAVKFDFFSPAAHKITLGYEFALNRDVHFELYSSYISNKIFPKNTSSYYEPQNLQGAGFRLSTKFRLADLNTNVPHSFNTWFVRLDLLYSRMSLSNVEYATYYYDPYYGYNYTVGHMDVDQYGMCINFGLQFLVGQRVIVQMNGGMGYLMNSGTFHSSYKADPNKHYHRYSENDYSVFRPYGNAMNIDNNPLCVTGNFTLGYILGKSKTKKK